jgi:hypothetical protein
MVQSFKKVTQSTNRLFKKAGGDANKFFNKSSKFIDKKIAGGLGSVSKVIREGVNQGGKILSAVERSPYGAALAPMTTAARGALGGAGLVGSVAGQSKGLIRAAYHGKPEQAIGNMLEKAKNIENTSKQIKFA